MMNGDGFDDAFALLPEDAEALEEVVIVDDIAAAFSPESMALVIAADTGIDMDDARAAVAKVAASVDRAVRDREARIAEMAGWLDDDA